MKNVILTALGALAVANGSQLVKDVKIHEWEKMAAKGLFSKVRSSVRNDPQTCEGGKVTIAGEDFPCDNIDFLSYVSLNEMEINRPHQTTGLAGADIWGWVSPSGKEIALMCMDNGMAGFDVSNPEDPCLFFKMASNRRPDPWCDIKVYKDTAYIVKDSRGGDWANDTSAGGQVVDLLPFDDIECSSLAAPLEIQPDHIWDFHGSAHNLVVNTESGYLYSVGGDKCSGGLVVMDLTFDRLKPQFIGCVDGDGYTHDAQCIVYDGPDTRFTGKEICFAFNEDTLTIWDVENKFVPVMLSRTEYPSQVYSHQGSVNDKLTQVYLDDELNEWCSDPALNSSSFCSIYPLGPVNGETHTSTVVIDIRSLTNPVYTGAFIHKDVSIDHNLYVWSYIHRKGQGGNAPLSGDKLPSGKFAYLNNYLAGIRVLDVSSEDVNSFKEVGFFDVAPDQAGITFSGVWSGYLFPSGVYAASSIDRGLFLLKPRMVFEKSEQETEPLSFVIVAVLAMVLTFSVIILIVVVANFFPVKPEEKASLATDAADQEVKEKEQSI